MTVSDVFKLFAVAVVTFFVVDLVRGMVLCSTISTATDSASARRL